MLKKGFIGIFCLWQTMASAQYIPETPAHSYFSLHNYSKWTPQAHAAGFNPAALGTLAHHTAFVYTEQRFLLKELSTYRFGAAIKTHSGVFGIQGSLQGQPDYRHLSTTLNYGRQLNEVINIGLGFEYSAYNIKGYGNAGYLNINAGTIIKLTEQLRTGITVKRIPAYQVNRLSNKQKPEFLVALGYDFSDQFYSAIQFEKIQGELNNVHMLLVYRATENLAIKGGLATAAPVYFGGISFTKGNITFDITSSYHPYLGVTPGLSLHFSPVKRNNEMHEVVQ